jgi:hypothetical protein
LRRLFEFQTDYRDIVLDLKEVGVVDREVMRFFMSCEADGVTLENCTPYIREMDGKRKGLRGSDIVMTRSGESITAIRLASPQPLKLKGEVNTSET